MLSHSPSTSLELLRLHQEELRRQVRHPRHARRRARTP